MRSNGVYYQPLGRPRHYSKVYVKWKRGVYQILGILVGVALVSCFVINTRLQRNQDAFETLVKTNYISGKLIESPICKLPILPLDNPEILKHLRKVLPIKCATDSMKFRQDWVSVNGTHAVLGEHVKKVLGDVTCTFTGIEWVDDTRIMYSATEIVADSYKFVDTDFVFVKCKAKDEEWKSFLACPRSKVEVRTLKGGTKKNPTHPPLNVLIWGIDSLSRNMFMRRLPKTYAYLIHDLHGIVLRGYNIVGDGTPQAIIPILTGQTELELPETRKKMGDAAKSVDVYPFIWSEFAHEGYTTAYLEDAPDLGTFTYRLKGFRRPPTDFYMRPYFLASDKHSYQFPPFCTGLTPTHQIIMNYMKDIIQYGPNRSKFVFSFQSQLSHSDNNPIQGEDVDLRNFFWDLEKNSVLNNSILIVFSDHGNRFSEFRETQQGKQEERMPMFMFVFPEWFKTVYKTAYDTFLRNAYILSTPFDIHPTLIDVLRIHKLQSNYFKTPHNVTQRGLSLFRSIPSNRTCKNAGIEPHWCACLQWRNADVSTNVVKAAALFFVDHVNRILSNYTGLCAPLRLHKVLKALELLPSQEMLHFKNSADADGRLPDMSDTMTVAKVTIQLKIETFPGKGRFEASMAYYVKKNSFKIQVNIHTIQGQNFDEKDYCDHGNGYDLPVLTEMWIVDSRILTSAGSIGTGDSLGALQTHWTMCKSSATVINDAPKNSVMRNKGIH